MTNTFGANYKLSANSNIDFSVNNYSEISTYINYTKNGDRISFGINTIDDYAVEACITKIINRNVYSP